MSNAFPSISSIIGDIKQGDEEKWARLVGLFESGLLGKARALLRNTKVGTNLEVPVNKQIQIQLGRRSIGHADVVRATIQNGTELTHHIRRNIRIPTDILNI